MVVAIVILGLLGVGAIFVAVWALAMKPKARAGFQDTDGPSADMDGLVRAGRKQDAVRAWRETASVARRDVKPTGEKKELRARPPSSPGVVPLRMVTDGDIQVHIRTGNLIDAIKLYREKTGVGLREAKTAVEAMRQRMSAS
jgi:ribosomal protein L7/L12